MVVQADLIVRARAGEYVVPSKEADPSTAMAELRSTIGFEVLEVLKGEAPKDLVLPGILADTDDFNDMPPPYRFVRPAGRWGNCWAYQYRNGAEYLLLLKRRGEGYTVDWYALGATNEQVRGELDPWVYWVKGFLAAQRADAPSRSANLKREGVQ